jgi:plastocyanin
VTRSRSAIVLAALLSTLVVSLLGAGAAFGADAKVAIGHYRWSPENVYIDLHQYVTWYWVGPDTMHSVTGMSANDEGIDSDPHTSVPHHKVGDTFRVTFNQPGVYYFQCKMHPIVHGWVHVSATPGNPADNPDPSPRPAVDLERPHLSAIHLAPSVFTVTGTTLYFTLDLAAQLDAEIWHTNARGTRATYAGWRTWSGHIGYNQAAFAAPSRHFRPAPGRYIAFFQATTSTNNLSSTIRVPFRISAPRRARDG